MLYHLMENDELVARNVSSFWFYLPFTLAEKNNVKFYEHDQACYLAVLFEGLAHNPQPKPGVWGAGAGGYSLSISAALEADSVGSLSFEGLEFAGQTRVHRNNEWAELRLWRGYNDYQGDDDLQRDAPAWVGAGGWNLQRTAYRKSTNHWSRTFAFGDVGGPLDESIIGYNDKGAPSEIVLVRRLEKGGSLTESICSIGRNFGVANVGCVPQLVFESPSNGKPAAMNEEKFLTIDHGAGGDRGGFAMVTCGAFSTLPADTVLAEARALSSANREWGSPPYGTVMDFLRKWAFVSEGVEGGQGVRRLDNVNNANNRSRAVGMGRASYPAEVLAFYDYTGSSDLS